MGFETRDVTWSMHNARMHLFWSYTPHAYNKGGFWSHQRHACLGVMTSMCQGADDQMNVKRNRAVALHMGWGIPVHVCWQPHNIERRAHCICWP